ncbi:unnamed protein product [Closterium sp. Yama58-4]|nr:unnamed protein product [Closterium sp. Yama58-4]
MISSTRSHAMLSPGLEGAEVAACARLTCDGWTLRHLAMWVTVVVTAVTVEEEGEEAVEVTVTLAVTAGVTAGEAVTRAGVVTVGGEATGVGAMAMVGEGEVDTEGVDMGEVDMPLGDMVVMVVAAAAAAAAAAVVVVVGGVVVVVTAVVVLVVVAVLFPCNDAVKSHACICNRIVFVCIVFSLIVTTTLLLPLLSPSSAADYPLCPLTQKPPQKPTIVPSRCVDAAEASCCENCFDVGFALSGVLANETTILSQFAPSLARLLGGTEIQLCSLFVGFHDCANELEQVNCAVNCNPDSGNYVRKGEGVGANPIFTMCDGYASKMFEDCKGLPVPGTTATFGQFLDSKERMLNKTFGAIFPALGYTNTTLEIVPGTTGCYNGPAKINPRALCCDPLVPPANCPAGTVDDPRFKKLMNRKLDEHDCAVYAGVPNTPIAVPPYLSPKHNIWLFGPRTTRVRYTRPTMDRFLSVVLSLLATTTLLLPHLPPTSAEGYPLCPFTQKPPQKPTIVPSRCVDAIEASCCESCFDSGMALSAVLANESTIVDQFAPSLAQLLGGTEVQLCSLFVGFHDCSNDFEQVGCAINCNPDSANYVRQTEGVGANPIFSMCDSFATKMFDDCKGLPVPGTAATFGQFLNSKERMLNKSFGAIFSALGYRSTSLEIVPGTTGCYNGPSRIPARVICCDPLVPPANCPAGTVDNPSYKKLFNRTLDKNDCAAYANVSDAAIVAGPAAFWPSFPSALNSASVSRAASLSRRLFQGFSASRRIRERSTQSTRSTRPARPSAQSAHFGTLANPEAGNEQAQFEKDKIAIMKIAVLGGTGNVGSKLAQRLCAAGHDVVLTSRHPGDEKTVKALEYVKEGGKGTATAAGVAEAVEGADAVIVATPGYATAEEWSKVVAPFASYAGVVLDASNSLTAWPALEIGVDHRSTSGGEELKKALPNAHVFKAFNTLGAELMVTPVLGGKPVAMLFAGSEDAAAKETATKDAAAKETATKVCVLGCATLMVTPTLGGKPVAMLFAGSEDATAKDIAIKMPSEAPLITSPDINPSVYHGSLFPPLSITRSSQPSDSAPSTLVRYPSTATPHAHVHLPVMPSRAHHQVISAVGFRPESGRCPSTATPSRACAFPHIAMSVSPPPAHHQVISAVGFRPGYVVPFRYPSTTAFHMQMQPPSCYIRVSPLSIHHQVISAVGFRPEYVGPLRYARNLESFAELWVHLALKQGWPRGGFSFDIQKA